MFFVSCASSILKILEGDLEPEDEEGAYRFSGKNKGKGRARRVNLSLMDLGGS